MNVRKISAKTIALLVAGALVIVTGTYTRNGGLQLAGALILVVGCILAFNEARSRDEDP